MLESNYQKPQAFRLAVTPRRPCSSYLEWITSCLLHKLEVLVCRRPHQPQLINSLSFSPFPESTKSSSLVPLLRWHLLALLPWPLYFVLCPFFLQQQPFSMSPLETPNPSFSPLICRWRKKKLFLFILQPFLLRSPYFLWEHQIPLFCSYSEVQSC